MLLRFALSPWRILTLLGTTLVLISCSGGPPPTAETHTPEASISEASISEASTAAVTPAAVTSSSTSAPPAVAPSTATTPATAVPAAAVTLDPGESRLLTPAELGWVERNLPVLGRQINPNQSFWVNLRDFGEVAFVLTEAVTDPSITANDLAIYLMSPEGNLIEQLPAHPDSSSWILWKPQAVSFWMYYGYESVIVIADYIIGAGPMGSEPFPVTTIYNNEGGYFTVDEVASRVLTDRGVSTVAEALSMLQTEELGYLP